MTFYVQQQWWASWHIIIQNTKILLIHPNIGVIKFSVYFPFKMFWDSLRKNHQKNAIPILLWVFSGSYFYIESWTVRDLWFLLWDTCTSYNTRACVCVSLLPQWDNILHILNHANNGTLHCLPPDEVLLTERLDRSVLWCIPSLSCYKPVPDFSFMCISLQY